jgi:hypothetical protein
MKTQYGGRKGPVRVASYYCRPVDADGRLAHSHFVGAGLVDAPVVQAILRALTPSSLEEAVAAISSDREQRAAVDKEASAAQAGDVVLGAARVEDLERLRRRMRSMFEEHSGVPQTWSEKRQQKEFGGPNGIRTRV